MARTPVRPRDEPIVTTHAVWLCACETDDDWLAWIIYAVGDAAIGWQRIPDGAEVAEVVRAEHLSGQHPAPEGVLEWLRGDAPDPGWSLDDDAERDAVFEEIHRRVRLARAR